MKRLSLVLVSIAVALVSCSSSAPKAVVEHVLEPRFSVKPGIEVLRDHGFDVLHGKKVGLVTNPSGVDRNLKSTIDILFEAPEVNLVALYGPEHGVRGDIGAGAHIEDYKDPATGLPVYSLYGASREPSAEMLKGVDVMVYDIQDVGTRSYTFISTLGLVMRACGTLGIEVVVLDRPNPLGGEKVEGCVVEPGYYSFVSQFRIPYIYGLTVGELATLINEEGLNRGQKGDQPHVKCHLTVVPMEGWARDMRYEDTGLPWILPSPNIPSSWSAICYPSSGIAGEFSGFLNIGIGYNIPFETFAAEWIDADALKARLDSYGIPGTAFRVIHYSPLFGPLEKTPIHGVQFFYPDYDAAEITLTQFYVMQAIGELYPEHNPFKEPGRKFAMFNLVCGTKYVKDHFGESLRVDDIRDYWMKDAESFKTLKAKYHLY